MTDEARQRRRTWVTGGSLLALAGILGLVVRDPLSVISFVHNVLGAMGAIVLVIGVGRAGSIVGRRPFSTTVVLLQIVVANPLVRGLVSEFPARNPQNLNEEEDAWVAVFMPYYTAVLVLTIASVILIGAARALPRPWSWAPAWVLMGSWALGGAWLLAFGAGAGLNPVTRVIAFLVVYAPQVGLVSLGALAVVLGLRATQDQGLWGSSR